MAAVPSALGKRVGDLLRKAREGRDARQYADGFIDGFVDAVAMVATDGITEAIEGLRAGLEKEKFARLEPGLAAMQVVMNAVAAYTPKIEKQMREDVEKGLADFL